MQNHPALRTGSNLSVIHKASTPAESIQHQEAVLQTDLSFNVTGWNQAAELLYGKPGGGGKNLFELVDIRFADSNYEDMHASLMSRGSWSGEILYRKHDGHQYHFRTIATIITDASNAPIAILIVNHDISSIRQKELELVAAEKKYSILMNTLLQGVLMLDVNCTITTINRRGAQILGVTEESAIGLSLASPEWKTLRADGSVFPYAELPAVVSLQTGFPQRNVVIGVERPDGMRVWLSVNSEALIHSGEFNPYAVVVSFTDITDSIFTENELKKSNERFYYASKITSDAIWDVDLETKDIYRSEAFGRLSGYRTDEIGTNLDWWFDKIHPEERERVKRKVNEHIEKGLDRWEDEYRFLCADGSYKHFVDLGIILYRNNKPVRILGAIRDVTEKKRLEKQLLDAQAKRHKEVTLAALAAQEQEKSNISRELHDNVNQILMSAKLFMDTAKRLPDEASNLLDKAIEYQHLALQEIRKLSKSLNTAHIKAVGLHNSVSDIIQGMKLLDMDVQFVFNSRVEEHLSDDQRLMLFRIIQEQTSNIIKYAQAQSVQISITEYENRIYMLIQDNGVGFDPAEVRDKGIGLINITNRAEAHNGQVKLTSAPGKGCKLEISFPV